MSVEAPKYKNEYGLGTAEFDVGEIMQETNDRLEKIISDSRLREKIVSGNYGVVLGVDDSGRVPALVMGKVLKEFGNVQVRFVSGGRKVGSGVGTERAEAESAVIFGISQEIEEGKDVLVVDDVVGSGRSVAGLCRELNNHGIGHDLLVLGVMHYEDEEGDLEKKLGELEEGLGGNIFYPAGASPVPGIYAKKQIAGVNKRKGEIFSEPNEEQNNEVLQYSREQVTVIAQNLIDDLNQQ